MKEVKLNEFMGKLVGDMGGAAIMANVILGEELGLHRAMADGKLITVQAPRGTGDGARTPGLTGLRGRRCGRLRACTWTRTRWSPRCAAMARCHGLIIIRVCSSAPCFFRRGYRANLISTWLPALDGVVKDWNKVPESRTSAADTGRRRSSWPRHIRTRPSTASISTTFDRASPATRRGGWSRQPRTFYPSSSAKFSGQRLRPCVLLRLPARHGRPGECSKARAPGAKAGGCRPVCGTLRQRRPRSESQPGRQDVLRGFHRHLHTELAFTGGGPRTWSAGRRTTIAPGIRRHGVLQFPPCYRDPSTSSWKLANEVGAGGPIRGTRVASSNPMAAK